MNRYKEEVQIAFTLCEIIKQLEALIRERYFDDFAEIIRNLKKDEKALLDEF